MSPISIIAIAAILCAVAFLIFERVTGSPRDSTSRELPPPSGDPALARSEVFRSLDRMRIYFEAAGMKQGADSLRAAMIELVNADRNGNNPKPRGV